MGEILFKRSANGSILRWEAQVDTGLINGFPVYIIKYTYGVLGGNLKTSYSDPIYNCCIVPVNRDI